MPRRLVRHPASILVLCLLFALLAAPAGADPSAARQEWPQFMYSARRGGFNPNESILDPSNVDELRQVWVRSTGLSIFTSPMVTGGTVYVTSADEHLYAFDAATGRTLGKIVPGGELQNLGSPAVVGGVVFLPTAGPNLHAIDGRSGDKLWSAPIGPSGTAPAVANGLVFAASQGTLWALDADTGAVVWTASPDVDYLTTSPAVADGIVYIGADDGTIRTFDAATGAELWTSEPAGGPISLSSPAVADGLVHIGSFDQGIYAFDAATGEIVWTVATEDIVTSSPAVAYGTVFVGSQDRGVYALDAATGANRWRALTGGVVSGSPAVANGVVYVTSNDLHLYAFQATTGRLLLKTPIDQGPGAGWPQASSPAVVNGMVFVGSTDANMYAFGL
jgi:outer membrane protein assembly factor BamB